MNDASLAATPEPSTASSNGASGSTTTDEKVVNSSSTTNDGKPAPVDPFTAISSMWSGWLAPTTRTATNNGNNDMAGQNSNNTGGPDSTGQESTTTTGVAGNTVATTATDLLQGAGKMWNDVSSTLKDAAGNVDTRALGEQVTVIRQKSGRLMEDVSRSVQSLNLSADISKSAEAISSSTLELIDKASQSLEQGRREALEIFVDADAKASTKGEASGATVNTATTGATYAPWEAAALPENERVNADALRVEMLKLVVDAIYSRKKRNALFLSNVAEKNGFQFDMDKRAGEALAALDADKNMRRLRAGLVPGKMKEEAFWQTYFYHVHRIRQSLVANKGVMPESAADEDEDDLFAEDNEADELAMLDRNSEPQQPPPPPTTEPVTSKPEEKSSPTPADNERNWEEDIEAAFKDDED